jgi:hypothetical protein
MFPNAVALCDNIGLVGCLQQYGVLLLSHEGCFSPPCPLPLFHELYFDVRASDRPSLNFSSEISLFFVCLFFFSTTQLFFLFCVISDILLRVKEEFSRNIHQPKERRRRSQFFLRDLISSCLFLSSDAHHIKKLCKKTQH